MKQMKRFMCAAFTVLMILALTACGSTDPQTVVLTTEQNGVPVEYQLDSLGDTVQTITQKSTVDCSMYTEEQISLFEASINEYAATYEAIEGVTYSSEFVDTNLVETICIDATNSDTLNSLSEQGLLPIDGTSSKIPLKRTVENLQSQGWTIKE